jgi:trimeric autotransporter adhesin
MPRDDFRLNRPTEGSQEDPAIAALKGGGFVAVWVDSDLDDPGGLGSDRGVYARLFGDDGRPLGREFRVHSGTAGDQFMPHVTALEDGGFAVAWASDGPNARGQTDPYFEGWGRVFDADGGARGRQFQLTPSNDEDHRIEAVETLADGTVLVVTASSDVSTNWQVNAVRFNARGKQVGDRERLVDAIDLGLSSIHASTAPGIDVAVRRDGGYTLAWREYPEGGSDRRIFVKRFEKDGDAEGRARAITEVAHGRDRDFPVIAELPGGRYAVAWSGDTSAATHGTEAYFRILNRHGAPVTPEVRVNGPDREDAQAPTDILHIGNGSTLVTYVSYNEALSTSAYDYLDVSARIFDRDGKPLTPAFYVSKTAFYEAAGGHTVLLDSGELMTVWDHGGTTEKDVSGRVWDLGARLDGGRKGDRLTGTDLKETISGRGGPDRLKGEGGDDRLLGGDGRDRLEGGPGDDRLSGGRGDDVFEFRRGGDHDRIVDFERGDRIDLRDFDLTRRDLEAATEASGDDVLIRLGRGDVLRVDDAGVGFVEDAVLL